MTVKTLTAAQKDAIVTVYQSKTRTIKQIAEFISTSTRTVGRVLEEKGIASPVPRLKGEARQAMQLLYRYKVSIAQLEDLLERHAGSSNRTVAPPFPVKIPTQTRATRKSPAGHNGKQSLLDVEFFDAYIPTGAA